MRIKPTAKLCALALTAFVYTLPASAADPVPMPPPAPPAPVMLPPAPMASPASGAGGSQHDHPHAQYRDPLLGGLQHVLVFKNGRIRARTRSCHGNPSRDGGRFLLGGVYW